MKLDPINLIGGFYQDDNLPWSAQDTVNWIPRPAENPGTLSPMKLVGAPGLMFAVDIADDPIRIGGLHNVEGRRFAVAGSTLYEVNADFSTTVRGTIPGVGPVTMQHNQLETGGNQLSIGNGTSSIYVFNTWDNTFTQVTDDAATGSVQTVYLNRRLIHMDPFGRFLYPSEVDDALSYDSLDRADSEASPDKFVGLGVNQFELVGFSQRTIEFYADTGATEQPFRPKKIATQRGCASRNSIVQVGGTLAWLGDDGIFYRLNGYKEEAISTDPINKAISENNWSNCFGMVWEDRKHDVAYWTMPDGKTWGWDSWTNLWHRRESFGLNRWRINAVDKWDNRWIAGDFQRGRLYVMDWNAYHEAGQPLVASRTAPPLYNNGNKFVIPRLELVFDTGRGTLSSMPPNPAGDMLGGYAGDTVTPGSYTANGGIPPFTFSVDSGSFPSGITLNPNGSWSGSFSAAGVFNWVIKVTDAIGQTGTLPDSATVLEYWSSIDRTINANGQMVLSNMSRNAQPVAAPATGTNYFGARGTLGHSTGRYYVEYEAVSENTALPNTQCGFGSAAVVMTTNGGFGDTNSGLIRWGGTGSVSFSIAGTSGGSLPTVTNGTRIGVAVDFDTHKVWVRVDSTWLNTVTPANPAGLVGTDLPIGTYFPLFSGQDNPTETGSICRLIMRQADMNFFPVGAWAPFNAWLA